jgi:PIN domain nuclease of toxin-antitoxin system
MHSVLLDTHVFIWLRVEPSRLSQEQFRTISKLAAHNMPMAISAITLWEPAKMVEKRRLELNAPVEMWLEEIETNSSFSVLPLTARIAAESVRLGRDFPRDLADQIIVATARCHGLTLLTADDRIRKWGKVPIL